jgi:excisionase family DNA binding protein
MTDDRNIRIEEAAHVLGVSPSTVKKLIRRGELVSYKIGTARLIPFSATQDWIAEQKRIAEQHRPEPVLRRLPVRRQA